MIKAFLGLFLISFITCYLIISWYNRFSNDDFEFLKMSSDLGIFGGIKYFYLNWEGAYFTEFLNFSFSSMVNNFHLKPFVFNVVIFVSIFCAFYLMVYRFLLFLSVKSVLGSLAIVSLVLGDLFYTDLALSEVWFWFNGNIAYLFTMVMLFISIYLLMGKSLDSKKIILPLILLFLFAGTRFNYSIMALGCVCLIIIYSYLFKLNIDRKIFIFIFIALLIGTIIYLIAPGNYIRKSNFIISYKINDILYRTLYISWDYIKKFVILKLPYHLIFILPAAFIASLFLKANGFSKKIPLVLCFIVTLVSVCLHSFVMYISKGAQTYRALPFSNFMVIAFLFILFLFILLNFNDFFYKMLYVLTPIFLVFGTSLFIRRLYIDYNVVKKYAIAVDDRRDLILNTKDHNPLIKTLYLCPLPSSGWLHSCEIGHRNIEKDASNNVRLETYYNLPFKIDLFRKQDSSCVLTK